MVELEDKVIVITGGGRGIGAAAAREFADRGATVHICGRTEEELERVASSSESIDAQILDLREADAVEEWLANIGGRHGRVDVVINNAGILGPKRTLDETDVEAFRQVMDINVVGAFATIRASYPFLKRSERPVVINLSSSVGRKGRASWGAYSISKFAVEGLTEVAADELSDHGACVVSLNPGGTATKMRAEAYPDEDPNTLPSPDDVASTLRLLVEVLTPAENGLKYSSRDLFEFADQETQTPHASELPTA